MADETTRLRAALDLANGNADEFHRQDCRYIEQFGYGYPCTCGEPARRRKAIEAHREIANTYELTVTIRDVAWNKYRAGEKPTDAEARDAGRADGDLAVLTGVIEVLEAAYGIDGDET